MKLRIPVVILCLLTATASITLAQEQEDSLGGPSIFSIPGIPFSNALGRPVAIRYYFGIHANASTNLNRLGLDNSQGSSRGNRAYGGGSANWGVYGTQVGPRDTFTFRYSGTYNRYANRYSGFSNNIGLNYDRQLSQRTTFGIGVNGGMHRFANTWTAYGDLGSQNLANAVDPSADPIDTRTLSVSAGATLSHYLTERWNVSIGGSGYLVERKDPRYLDSEGASARGSVAYRFENSSIGASYGFNYFFFPNGFGEAYNHTLQLNYNRRLNQRWSLSLGGGISRIENERLQRVEIDPVIAAITGQRALLQAAHSLVYRPAIGATLGAQFERSGISFYYSKSISPGTAFTTTSLQDGGGGRYSYTATENLHVSVNASFSKRSALLQQVNNFNSYGGGMGLSYRLWRYIHLSGNVGLRRWQVRDSDFKSNRVDASFGLNFSPGDTPLAIF